MAPSSKSNVQRRQRTKQSLSAPRHVIKRTTSDLEKKLVWVTEGKTEHQAWLLEEIGENPTVLIQWESTGANERVPVLSVRHDMPGRRSRRGRDFFVTDDFEQEERTLKRMKREKKTRHDTSGKAVASLKPTATDARSKGRLTWKQVAMKPPADMSGSTRSKPTIRGVNPTMKCVALDNNIDSSDDEAGFRRKSSKPPKSNPPRGYEVELMKTQRRGLAALKTENLEFSGTEHSSDDENSSDDEAVMRKASRTLTRKSGKQRRHLSRKAGKDESRRRFPALTRSRVNEDESSIPTLLTDLNSSRARKEQSKKSSVNQRTKKVSITITSAAFNSLKQSLEADTVNDLLSFGRAEEENNLQEAIAASLLSNICDC